MLIEQDLIPIRVDDAEAGWAFGRLVGFAGEWDSVCFQLALNVSHVVEFVDVLHRQAQRKGSKFHGGPRRVWR